MGHMIFAALATIDDTRAIGLYAKLRAAYNISRPPDSLPVPPLEEWQGVTAFCTDLHCRQVETFHPSPILTCTYDMELKSMLKFGEWGLSASSSSTFKIQAGSVD